MKNSKHNENTLPGLDLMALILVLWLCSLPFIGLVIAPFFGVQAALLAALLLLIGLLLYCWGRCLPQALRFIQQYRGEASENLSDETNPALVAARIRVRRYQNEAR